MKIDVLAIYLHSVTFRAHFSEEDRKKRCSKTKVNVI